MYVPYIQNTADTFRRCTTEKIIIEKKFKGTEKKNQTKKNIPRILRSTNLSDGFMCYIAEGYDDDDAT